MIRGEGGFFSVVVEFDFRVLGIFGLVLFLVYMGEFFY